MTDQERKAMEMALDSLVECARLLGSTQAKKGHGIYTADDAKFEVAMYESIYKHKAALRQALNVDAIDTSSTYVDENEKREHEPVAWIKPDKENSGFLITLYEENGWTPLYTAPPSKPWVSLTDEEKWSIFTSKDWTGKPLSLIDAVLTAYEEKNRD